MPIRMVKDEEPPERNEGGKNGRSAGGLGKGILGAILGLVIKKPKLLIPILLLAGAAYFFLGKEKMSNVANQLLSMGCEMKREVYDKAEVFEPLSAAAPGYGLPESVSLEQYCPKRLNQGNQGSCVGWSSSYAARTILQAIATGKNPNDIIFSPSSLYNQISLPGCQGAYIQNAMQVMHQKGVLPFSQFAYNENDCEKLPTKEQLDLMSQYKTKGFNRLTASGENYSVDIEAIKQNLAQGAPVVIGMLVGGSFMQNMVNQDIWIPTQSDYDMGGFGGHAMCVIGYDDKYEGGAFQIMNSWGEEWGNKGISWVRYADFLHFTKEAYGLYPMGNIAVDQDLFSIQFGLIDVASKKSIPLKQQIGNVFETQMALAKKSKFKISVSNKNECYIYVFGQETDKSSYVLFPYTEKHSAYCGIIGTRLFPKDYSMSPDEIGNRDVMAIVISKQQMDFNKLNQTINQTKGNSYAEKINNALNEEMLTNITYKTGEYIGFETKAKGKNFAVMVVEIKKK